MSGGLISGNVAVGQPLWNIGGGGGLCIRTGYFVMSGGVITNNTAHRYGGGVYKIHATTYDTSGGGIYGNTADVGDEAYE
jgi:hypothetical protein